MSENLFENFELIIHIELMRQVEKLPCPPTNYYMEVTKILEEDTKRIFKKINSIKMNHSSKNKAAWAIQAFQEKIDSLLGTLGVYMEKLSFTIIDYVIPDSWQALIMEIMEYLKGLMNLLVTRHPDLFDIGLYMSEVVETYFVKETRQKLNEELEQLQEGTACHKAYQLLFLPIEEPEDSFQYRHLFYYQVLIAEASKIIHGEMEDAAKAGLIRQLLWRFNFNHPVYAVMIRREYAVYLDNSQGIERIKKCLEIRKKIRLNKPLSGAHLYILAPSLEKQSELWLNMELKCIRALMVAESIIATNPFAGFKVKTTLSLPQIAGLLRLFLNEDKRELIRFISTYFITASGKSFSPAALTRSYDQNKGKPLFQQLKGLFEPK